MNYRNLITEHEAVEAAAFVVVTMARPDVVRTVDAKKALHLLDHLLHDHLAGDGAAVYNTIPATQGGRHAETAERLRVELDRLRDDWEAYLCRWNPARIVRDWTGFALETAAMVGRVRERVAFETMILYSLALRLDAVKVD